MTDAKILVEGMDELYALDAWFDSQTGMVRGVTAVTFDTVVGSHVTVVDDDELLDGGSE